MTTFYQIKQQRSNLYLACLAAFICLMTIKLSYFVPTVLTMRTIYFFVKCLAAIITLKFIILDDFSAKIKLLVTGIIIIFYFLAKKSLDSNIFYYAVLLIGAADVDFDKILKTYLLTVSISVFFILFSCLTQMIPEQIVARSSQLHISRLSLGFLTPTDLAARCFYLMAAYYAWRELLLKNWEKVVFLLFTLLIFTLTNARLDLLMMLLLWFIGFKPSWFKNLITKLEFRGLAILTAIYICLNVSLAYFYDPYNSWFRILDRLLSSRLSLGNIALHQHGVPWFGQYVAEHSNGGLRVPTNYFYVDSSYIRLLVISGVIITIIVLTIIFYLLWKFCQTKSYGLLAFLLLTLLSSAIDQHLVEVSYNIVLLAAFATVTAPKQPLTLYSPDSFNSFPLNYR